MDEVKREKVGGEGDAPRELCALVADRAASASLLAHLSILLGARVPVLVAGPASVSTRDRFVNALVAALRPTDKEGLGGDTAHPVVGAEAADLAALLASQRAAHGSGAREEMRRFGVALFIGEAKSDDGTAMSASRHGRLISAHLLQAPEGAGASGSSAPRPTLLATWSEEYGRWDDFAWAAIPVLAARCGASHEAYARLLAEREAALGS